MPATTPTRPELLVLIIEDDPQTAAAFALALSATFRTEVVGTMSEALERMSQKDKPAVNAVLLDLILPNGRGMDVIRRMQTAHPDVPMVVTTGHDFDERQAIHSGAHLMLRKPVLPITTLEESLIRAIARHQVRWRFQPLEDQKDAIKDSLNNASIKLEAARQEIRQVSDSVNLSPKSGS